MDPNEALRAMRDAVAHLRTPPKDPEHGFTINEGNEREYAWNALGESFEALDQWLSRGGFLPTDWTYAQSRQNPNMIIVESSTQLDMVRKVLNFPGIHKMRVWIDGDAVKFKMNEYTWSPPIGRVQEPY